MKLIQKEHNYTVELEKSETVSIEVNGVIVFATTVPDNYKGTAHFVYHEQHTTEAEP